MRDLDWQNLHSRLSCHDTPKLSFTHPNFLLHPWLPSGISTFTW